MIDELWEKYQKGGWATQEEFIAAMTEYGEYIKAEAVKVCHTVESVKWNMSLSGKPTTLKCADAIEKMEIK